MIDNLLTTKVAVRPRRSGESVPDAVGGRGSFAEFLRACRAAVDVARAGLAADAGRRVSGLRREEVAGRAGVSLDYYTRLEQGRERNPSPQVLESLSRALCLDADQHAHLFQLTGVPMPVPPPATQVDRALVALLHQVRDAPAAVLGHDLSVLAQNAALVAHHSPFAIRDNMAQMVFLDDVARDFFYDWHDIAAVIAGSLRVALGRWPDDDALRSVIERLYAESPEFQELWSSHTVRTQHHKPVRVKHPIYGDLTLSRQRFIVEEASGQQLAVLLQWAPEDATS